MLDLSRKLDDKLEIFGKTYHLRLSFDNILRIFEMWDDEEVEDIIKPHLALRMLTGETFKRLEPVEAMDVFKEIFEESIQIKTAKDLEVEYDLAGNVLKTPSSSETDGKILYNIRYDGDFIFASFMQAYGIDLLESQGKLHWQKFNALLSGLPEGTKFVEVVKIRDYSPSKGESREYIDRMRKLQKEYQLPGSDDIPDEESDEYG